MAESLRRLWPLVDLPDPRVAATTISDWPAQRLVQAGVLRQAENAAWVRCPECGQHEEEVLAVEGPAGQVRFMISCPEVLRVEVPPALLTQWTIHLAGLARHLARVLGVSGGYVEVVPKHVWRLGRGHYGGAARDVLFARGLCTADNGAVEAAIRSSLRPVVLVPWRRPRAPLWGEPPPIVATLADLVTLGDAGLEFDHQGFQGLIGRSEPAPEECIFQRRGEFWVLAFAGHTIYLKDSVGLAYLARLVSEPNRDVPAVSLLAARAGIDPDLAAGSSGELLDATARARYAERYVELCEELDRARQDNDLGRLEMLQAEMDQLAAELARATGLGGRSRERTDADKVRKSVSMAVWRDVERIGQQHAALGQHLTLGVRSGLVFRYAPDRERTWLT